MPVIFVTAEPVWSSTDATWPLSERWPVIEPDAGELVRHILALYASGDGEPVLVVSTDATSHHCAASIVAALCMPEVGHLRLGGAGTSMWLQARAITMIPDGYLGLAEALARRLVSMSRSYAAVSSVVSLSAPVPGVGDVLRSACIPGSRFWADVGSQTITSLKEAHMGDAVAAVIAHGAGRWDDALDGLRLPQFQADLGRMALGDELWKCKRWVEVTVASQAPGILVQEMQTYPQRRCKGCPALTVGLPCVFCGQTSPATELSGARQ